MRAADEDRTLDGLSDHDLLALAAGDERVMVTFDVADFPTLVRRWAEEGRAHAGCAIVVGIDHSEFGTIIRTVAAAISRRPEQADWRDYTCFISRTV